MAREICQGTRNTGAPCRGWALPGSRFCLWHDPTQEGKRQQARATGGRHSATPTRLSKLVPASLRPTLQKLVEGVDEVHAGTLDPRQAGAMAALSGAIVRMYEVASLEERLQRLEEQNERRNPDGRGG